MPNHPGPMSCPNDGATLVMSERSGIEIDYCPTCRGVWLDRGELDKIIERSQAEFGSAGGGQQPQAPPPPQGGSPWNAPPPYPQHQPYGQGYGGKPHKRRKSFLEELFD